MKASPFQKLVLLSLLLAAGLALLLHFFLPKPHPRAVNVPTVAQATPAYHYTPPTPRTDTNAAEAEADTDADPDQPKSVLTKEQLEAWLLNHHRNARSLLAAFRCSHDTNYLNEAAANFPTNASVQLAVLAHDEFPADRRKWLDLLKASSPGNSLANYLSAQDYFKNGQPDQAVQELLAASGKTQFDNDAIANMLDARAMYKESGTSDTLGLSYAMGDMTEDNLPELITYRELDSAMVDLMKKKTAAGDPASAANVAAMGMQFANNINSGDSGKFLVNSMIASATENAFTSQLDPNTAYDFLNGQTPAQVQQQLKADKADFKQLQGQFQPVETGMEQDPNAMEAYYQRMLIYGEPAAMKWAIQQYGKPPGTNPGQ